MTVLQMRRNADHEFVPSSLWTNILEIIETTGFVTPYILHPIQGVQTYFPAMGVTPFDPENDIDDLAGKVILVTGGRSLLLEMCSIPRLAHVGKSRQ